jgi:UPF0176 protein
VSVLSVVTVYRFTQIEKPYLIKARLGDWIGVQDIKGTLIIAPEGINGTLSGPKGTLEPLIEFLAELLDVSPLETKWSTCSVHPFGKLKFPLKNEIVTMGDPKPDPTQLVGTYVAPDNWNALISDPEVILVDTRNWYEVELGSFEGAVNPQTDAFRDFEAWVKSNLDPAEDKKVAMFCTGGIRCEKASSYLLEEGFESVFHLQGGILNYLEHVEVADSMWEGECFVFDDRVTLAHGLEIGASLICKGCGKPTKDAKLVDGPSDCPHCFAPMVSRSSLEMILA